MLDGAPRRRPVRYLLIDVPPTWSDGQESGVGLFATWYTPDGTRVRSVRTAPPSLPCASIVELRNNDLDIIDAAGVRVMTQVVARHRNSDYALGLIYLGELVVPWAESTFAIQILGTETLPTLRESTVLDAALESGSVTHGVGTRFEGWFADTPPGLMRNLAEDPKYDAQFESHPLSRVRAMLHDAVNSLTLPADAERWRPLPLPESEVPAS